MKSTQTLIAIIGGAALVLGAFPQTSRATLDPGFSDELLITDGIFDDLAVREGAETAVPPAVYVPAVYLSSVAGNQNLNGHAIWLTEPGVLPSQLGYYSDVVGVTTDPVHPGQYLVGFMSDSDVPANYATWFAAAQLNFGAPASGTIQVETDVPVDVLNYVDPVLRDPTLTSPPVSLAQFQSDVEVPEPTTLVAGALLLLPFGASTLRVLRKKHAA
jgi:hypothetical protein